METWKFSKNKLSIIAINPSDNSTRVVCKCPDEKDSPFVLANWIEDAERMIRLNNKGY